jgi:hypothetical protein
MQFARESFLNPQLHADRYVVGPLRPVARILQHDLAFQLSNQIRRDPDVVQSPPSVRCTPVAVAIGPPRVELLVRGHEVPHRIDEAGVLPRG